MSFLKKKQVVLFSLAIVLTSIIGALSFFLFSDTQKLSITTIGELNPRNLLSNRNNYPNITVRNEMESVEVKLNPLRQPTPFFEDIDWDSYPSEIIITFTNDPRENKYAWQRPEKRDDGTQVYVYYQSYDFTITDNTLEVFLHYHPRAYDFANFKANQVSAELEVMMLRAFFEANGTPYEESKAEAARLLTETNSQGLPYFLITNKANTDE